MDPARASAPGVPFILLAHHRSGSNFLGDVLQNHPSTECLSEPLSMHTSAYLRLDLMRWTTQQYDSEILHPGLQDFPGAVSFTGDLAAYLTSVPVMQARGFKETVGFEKLPWLREVFPGVRLIVLVRDPRAVVRAILSRQMEDLWDYGRTLSSYRDRHGSGLPFPVQTATPLERAVSSWQVRLWEIRQHLDDVLIVRFEDVVADPQAALTPLMRRLDLEVDPAQLAWIAASHSGPSRGGAYSTVRDPAQVTTAWQRELPGDVVRFITQRLSTEMEWLGYV